MAQKTRLEFEVFANTKQAEQSIGNLHTQLQQVMNVGNNMRLGGIISNEFTKASAAAQQLQVHLSNATKDGEFNINKFNSSLKASGSNVQTLTQHLTKAGAAGVQSFSGMANQIINAQAPIRATSALLTKMTDTLLTTARWQLSSNLLMGLTSSIKDAYNYTKKLSSELSHIRVVTGYSREEMDQLAKSANKMARDLKTSTLDVVKGQLIYQQQGDSMALAAKKAEITIKATATATEASAEEMSNYLTAVWNSYKVGEAELERYVDKANALGAQTAASQEEIFTAMEKSAAAANAVGVSYDQLGATIATISAVTRNSAETIGTTLKTVYARVADLKVNGPDEDGIGLGQVSSGLQQLGIEVLDAQGELRDMGSVIEEIGMKYQGWTEAQQAAAVQLIAGKRQYTQMMALFENWDMYSANKDISQNADGTLDEQYKEAVDNIESASKRVTAEVERIWQSLLDDEAIIKIVDLFGNMVRVVGNVVDSLGGFKGVIITLGMLFSSRFIMPAVNGIAKLKEQFAYLTGKTLKEHISVVQQIGLATKTSLAKESGFLNSTDMIEFEQIAIKADAQAVYLQNEEKLTDVQKQRYQNLLLELNLLTQMTTASQERAEADKTAYEIAKMETIQGANGKKTEDGTDVVVDVAEKDYDTRLNEARQNYEMARQEEEAALNRADMKKNLYESAQKKHPDNWELKDRAYEEQQAAEREAVQAHLKVKEAKKSYVELRETHGVHQSTLGTELDKTRSQMVDIHASRIDANDMLQEGKITKNSVIGTEGLSNLESAVSTAGLDIDVLPEKIANAINESNELKNSLSTMQVGEKVQADFNELVQQLSNGEITADQFNMQLQDLKMDKTTKKEAKQLASLLGDVKVKFDDLSDEDLAKLKKEMKEAGKTIDAELEKKLEEAKQDIVDLGTQAGLTGAQLDDLMGTTVNSANSEGTKQAGEHAMKRKGDELIDTAQIDKQVASLQNMANTLQTIASLGTSLSMFKDALDFSNEMSGWERFTQILLAVSMLMPVVTGLMKAYSVAQEIVIKKKQKDVAMTQLQIFWETIKQMITQNWIAIAVIGIAAVIGLVSLFTSKQETAAERAERLREEQQAAADAASKLSEEAETLADKWKKVSSLKDNLDSMTEGTDAWRQATHELNKEVNNLIKDFPNFAKYIKYDENGKLTFDAEGIAKEQGKLQASSDFQGFTAAHGGLQAQQAEYESSVPTAEEGWDDGDAGDMVRKNTSLVFDDVPGDFALSIAEDILEIDNPAQRYEFLDLYQTGDIGAIKKWLEKNDRLSVATESWLDNEAKKYKPEQRTEQASRLVQYWGRADERTNFETKNAKALEQSKGLYAATMVQGRQYEPEYQAGSAKHQREMDYLTYHNSTFRTEAKKDWKDYYNTFDKAGIQEQAVQELSITKKDDDETDAEALKRVLGTSDTEKVKEILVEYKVNTEGFKDKTQKEEIEWAQKSGNDLDTMFNSSLQATQFLTAFLTGKDEVVELTSQEKAELKDIYALKGSITQEDIEQVRNSKTSVKNARALNQSEKDRVKTVQKYADYVDKVNKGEKLTSDEIEDIVTSLEGCVRNTNEWRNELYAARGDAEKTAEILDRASEAQIANELQSGAYEGQSKEWLQTHFEDMNYTPEEAAALANQILNINENLANMDALIDPETTSLTELGNAFEDMGYKIPTTYLEDFQLGLKSLSEGNYSFADLIAALAGVGDAAQRSAIMSSVMAGMISGSTSLESIAKTIGGTVVETDQSASFGFGTGKDSAFGQSKFQGKAISVGGKIVSATEASELFLKAVIGNTTGGGFFKGGAPTGGKNSGGKSDDPTKTNVYEGIISDAEHIQSDMEEGLSEVQDAIDEAYDDKKWDDVFAGLDQYRLKLNENYTTWETEMAKIYAMKDKFTEQYQGKTYGGKDATYDNLAEWFYSDGSMTEEGRKIHDALKTGTAQKEFTDMGKDYSTVAQGIQSSEDFLKELKTKSDENNDTVIQYAKEFFEDKASTRDQNLTDYENLHGANYAWKLSNAKQNETDAEAYLYYLTDFVGLDANDPRVKEAKTKVAEYAKSFKDIFKETIEEESFVYLDEGIKFGFKNGDDWAQAMTRIWKKLYGEEFKAILAEDSQAAKAIVDAVYDREMSDIQALADYAKEKLLEPLEQQLAQLEGKTTILERYHETTNSIRDAQHELNKELQNSLINYQYLDAETRKLLFNEEDYLKLSQTLNDTQTKANKLQREYNRNIIGKTEEQVELITNEYERQYELLMKQYEIAKADLEITKKKQALINTLNERNTQMFINGRWTWVADTNAIIQAQNDLADAQKAKEDAENDLSQTQEVQRLKRAADDIQKSINDINEDFDELKKTMEGEEGLIEQFKLMGGTVEKVMTKLRSYVTNAKQARSETLSTSSGTNSSGSSSSSKKDPYEGLATGTPSATPGLKRVIEEGSELLATNQGFLYEMSGGEMVFNNDQFKFLYELSKNPVNSMLQGLTSSTSSIDNSININGMTIDGNSQEGEALRSILTRILGNR